MIHKPTIITSGFGAEPHGIIHVLNTIAYTKPVTIYLTDPLTNISELPYAEIAKIEDKTSVFVVIFSAEGHAYREFKQKLDKDPNFQKWILYDSILDLIYNPDTKINDKLPSTKNIAELMKLNGTNMLPRDVTDFVKVLSSLSILRTSGGSKYIGK